jgi:hypothetical protein
LAEDKITEEVVQNIRSWKHSGFSVDQSVRLAAGDALSGLPSNHATTGAAAAVVLATWFGNDTAFWITSETLSGATRSFTSFSEATVELNDARVFGGIHFRTAVEVGRKLGSRVAEYVLETALHHAERKR